MDRENPLLYATDQNFEEEVVRSEKPVLVDFWATWCGPCKAVGPIVEEIAALYGARIKVVHLNVDENPHVTETYSIKNIPTLILFKNGKPFESLVGLVPKESLEEFVNKAL